MEDKLALVFSGGGAKGAFGVGVLGQIITELPKIRWHIVSGTSTGSLIAPFAALAAKDRRHYETLKDLYEKVEKKNIIKSNFGLGGIVRAAFDFPEGVFTFKKRLEKLIDERLPRDFLEALAASETVVATNAVSLQTGKLVICTQERHRPSIEKWFAAHREPGEEEEVSFLDFSEFKTAMLGSSAIPGAIDPIKHNNEQLVDGGVVDIAPLRTAIAAGATHILIVLMSQRTSAVTKKKYSNIFKVGGRALELITDEVVRNDVKIARLVSHLSQLARHLTDADEQLPPALARWFSENRKEMAAMAGRRVIELHVIEPEHHLGETLEFNESTRPSGWPEKDEGDPTPIMQLRISYGMKLAKQRLEADDGLRNMLKRFAAQ
ncbi:MAG: patatin-like phospholipase family protein [Phycisphaerales bacterium]